MSISLAIFLIFVLNHSGHHLLGFETLARRESLLRRVAYDHGLAKRLLRGPAIS